MRGISAPAAAMLMCLSAAALAVETPPEGAPAPDFIGDGWSDGGELPLAIMLQCKEILIWMPGEYW